MREIEKLIVGRVNAFFWAVYRIVVTMVIQLS